MDKESDSYGSYKYYDESDESDDEKEGVVASGDTKLRVLNIDGK